MKVVSIGSNGQVGKCIQDSFRNFEHEIIHFKKEDFNILDKKFTSEVLKSIKPDYIINCAAFTSVDEAEKNPEIAYKLNHKAVKNLANITKLIDATLIHISTDYVFDGKSKKPYTEQDITNPESIYGKSKLDGEQSILESKCKYFIIRTAWVFSEYGNNFMKTIIKAALNKNSIDVVCDQIGCPTYAMDIANTIKAIVEKGNNTNNCNVYNFCGDQPCSWYDFANKIFDKMYKKTPMKPIKINSISSSKFKSAATRPKYSVLNCSKIKQYFDIDPSNWNIAIDKVLIKLQDEKF